MASGPSIAIIGAGPAGLTLAKLLLVSPLFTDAKSKSKINLSIFELDASARSRTHQGGTLDLHPQTGLLALKKCGLWEAALPYLRYEGEELVIGDRNGMQFVHITETKEISGKGTGDGKWDQRPELDRERLKDVLLEGVGEGRIKWGRKLKSVFVTEQDGRGELEFEDGSVEGPFDLVIGADGAFSKVRPVLTDVKPRYSGICGVEGGIQKPKQTHPEVDKMVGRGSYFAYGDNRSLMGQRLGDDSIKMATWGRRDKEWVESLWKEKGDDPEAVRAVLLDEYQDWIEEMRDWIRASELFRPWVLWELPVGHTWQHRQGFTMIGDAAHLCTPFAGLGVNAAMKDALELSDLIIESVSGQELTLDDAVDKYEKGMFPRAHEVQRRTMTNKETMFRSDAPVGFMTAMMGVLGEETGWPIDKGVLRFIPISKLAFAAFWMVEKFGLLRRWFRETFSKRKRT